MILVRRRVLADPTAEIADKRSRDGRIVTARFATPEREWRFASVYAPSSSAGLRPAFFRSLRRYLTSKHVVGGDWNCVPNVSVDRVSITNSEYDNIGIDELHSLINTLHLRDEARLRAGSTARIFTRYGPTSHT
eukprot:5857853-Prorocentrum_lima.AAC.1